MVSQLRLPKHALPCCTRRDPAPLRRPRLPRTVDPIVFLAEAEDAAVARLEVGQMRRVRVDGASLFDLDATVVV